MECRRCCDQPKAVTSNRMHFTSRWVMDNRHVDREYADEELYRLSTDAGFRPDGWSDREISDFRVLDQCARAARLDADLRNTRMLRIEPSRGGDPNRVWAALSSGRGIELIFKNTEGQGVVFLKLLDPETESPHE